MMATLIFLGSMYIQRLERQKQARLEQLIRQRMAEIAKEIQVCEDADRRGLPYDPKPGRAIAGALPENVTSWRQEADWLREIIYPIPPKP